MKTPDWLDWKIWLWSVLFNWLRTSLNETDFTLMRQSILVGETVCTSILDDILVVVHIKSVQSDWWWVTPSNI